MQSKLQRFVIGFAHVLFFVAFLSLIIVPKNGILSYTRNGMATIKKGGHPCAVCFAPTTTITYVGTPRGIRQINSFCTKHAPTTLKWGDFSWEGNILFGWVFGALFPLFFPFAGLVDIMTGKKQPNALGRADPEMGDVLIGVDALCLAIYLLALWVKSW